MVEAEQNELKIYDLIFSIGEACSCSEALRAYKLQNFSYPFDWLYGSTFQQRIELIKSKFKNFINFEDLEYKHPVKTVNGDAYWNKSNGIIFNHDFPKGISLAESYPGVREKYDRRINRLIDLIEKSESFLMIYLALPESDDLASNEDLLKAQFDVQKTFPQSKCNILYLQHNPDLPLDKLIYEEISPMITKVFLYNKSIDTNAEVYDINTINVAKVFINYQLTQNVMTPLKIKLAKMKQQAVTDYCNALLGN